MFRVPSGLLEGLARRIEALDRRAARLGCEPIGLRDTGERDPDGNALVVLDGRAPALTGWMLAAIVEHRDGKVSVRAVADAGERLRPEALAGGWCEHCGLRRRRTKTFVVVHVASGEMRQVGSGCLRDFLGGQDPERACRQAERLALVRDEMRRAERAGPTPGSDPQATLERFAAHAAHVIRAHGWTTREQARAHGVPASTDLALRSLTRAANAPGPGDEALADGALRWARTLLASKPGRSRFEREAAAVANAAGTLGRREQGLVCAMIAVYRRRRARSRHLGRPGAPVDATVLVERVVRQPSRNHGTVCRCELLDADANRLVWWQTQGPPLRAGDLITLAGRVQRHTRFGDTPVTVLSHWGVRAEKETFAA